MPKTDIIERLGESALLVPGLITAALAANDRLKLRLTLLQDAVGAAARPGRTPQAFDAERQACGLEAGGPEALIAGVGPDLRLMLAPLDAAKAPAAGGFARRLETLLAGLPQVVGGRLDPEAVGAMTRARRGGVDSVHLLVMDLHKAINQLAEATAAETVDGARTYQLTDWDRARVRAFMAGLHRTAPLVFGHPGLGALAARAGGRLTLQNDIGETDAHVLVIHIDDRVLTVTYTDVHRRRAKFFMGLFGERLDWSPLAEQAAEGLGDDERFYLLTGRFEAVDDAALDDLLAWLGSRIVFLIDWNKARKALQTFGGRDAAIALLDWAAGQDLGHRAFLELGGADLVFEAVRRGAAGRVPYGARLDAALGAGETLGFLRRVLRETSEGLTAGRSARLIRDEIQADLAQRFETAGSAVLAIMVRHLGLSRTLAAAAADHLAPGSGGRREGLAALVERSTRLEAKADRLTVQAREICARLHDNGAMRRLVDAVEDAMDALDEAVFLISLQAGAAPPTLSRLADIVLESFAQMVRATEAAAGLPDGARAEAMFALQAIDAVTLAEREADAAERAAVGALMNAPAADARALVQGLEVARALESITDHVAHAALALRERVLEELSA